MTINDHPTTEAQLTVLAKYPDATVKDAVNKTDGKEFFFIWAKDMLIGFGDTIDLAWENAAEVIGRGGG